MFLGRVIGSVWSTMKDRNLEGQRLLLIQPVTPELKNTGRIIVCTDCTGSGAGELIYWCRGKESSFPFLPQEVPTDTCVVAVVDEVSLAASRPAVSPAPAGPAPE